MHIGHSKRLEPREVGGIEREDVFDPMDQHQGSDMGIMDLTARNSSGGRQVQPPFEYSLTTGQYGKQSSDPIHDGSRLSRRAAQTVAGNRSSGDAPELDEILSGDV